MPKPTPDLLPTLPRRGLSREITVALLVKIVLLWGLWHFAIRPNKPAVKPDIADVFRPSQVSGLPLQPLENTHVR